MSFEIVITDCGNMASTKKKRFIEVSSGNGSNVIYCVQRIEYTGMNSQHSSPIVNHSWRYCIF